jgi:hypothetical protein
VIGLISASQVGEVLTHVHDVALELGAKLFDILRDGSASFLHPRLKTCKSCSDHLGQLINHNLTTGPFKRSNVGCPAKICGKKKSLGQSPEGVMQIWMDGSSRGVLIVGGSRSCV